MKKLASLFGALALVASTAASAGHIFVTDPSVNGVPLDSPAGFTNPTITAVQGSTLSIVAGFYDYCGGACATTWTMHLAQTGGSLTLSDISLFAPTGSSGSPLYLSFDQLLTASGTWTGFLQPINGPSCPSYRYGNGVEGGSGCGSPSESIPFSLNVTAAPEPVSLALLGIGLLGFGLRRRKA